MQVNKSQKEQKEGLRMEKTRCTITFMQNTEKFKPCTHSMLFLGIIAGSLMDEKPAEVCGGMKKMQPLHAFATSWLNITLL